jgi:antitoxin component of MazEF toxin-antitoxin module
MTMIKQLKKVGNSNAVILDKAIMELVGLEENDELQLSVHHGSIILTPTDPKPVDMIRFEACLNRVVMERRDVLRRLAQ